VRSGIQEPSSATNKTITVLHIHVVFANASHILMLQLSTSTNFSCFAAIPLLEGVAQAFLPPACNALPSQAGGLLPPPTTDPHGTLLPQDLPDIRTYRGGLPQNLYYQSFMEAEGSTYYW